MWYAPFRSVFENRGNGSDASRGSPSISERWASPLNARGSQARRAGHAITSYVYLYMRSSPLRPCREGTPDGEACAAQAGAAGGEARADSGGFGSVAERDVAAA